MQEAFLHYIWQHQYFDKKKLLTDEEQELIIESPGFLNTDAGPDFSNGSLNIAGIQWSGSIEIHVKSSDWFRHKHDKDKAYNTVVLHVVWQNDKPATRFDGSFIPTLELKNRVDSDLLLKYKRLINSPVELIPCEYHFSLVGDITKFSMMDKLVMERLQVKSEDVLERLHRNKGDWEETTYQFLLRSLGLKVNSEVFEMLAKSLPFKIVKKYQQSALQLEALFYGMAGFLEEKLVDSYQGKLQEEFKYLEHKHQLARSIDSVQWKFMRLRPANFPTVRLSQLAAVLSKEQAFFNKLISGSGVHKLKKWFDAEPADYWKKHYKFGKPSKSELGGMGQVTIDLLVINTIAPLLVAYGRKLDDQNYIDKAVLYLEEIKAENNKITRTYKSLGLIAKSAMDSQALIQWHNEYCQKKQCLKCAVGMSVLNK